VCHCLGQAVPNPRDALTLHDSGRVSVCHCLGQAVPNPRDVLLRSSGTRTTDRGEDYGEIAQRARTNGLSDGGPEARPRSG